MWRVVFVAGLALVGAQCAHQKSRATVLVPAQVVPAPDTGVHQAVGLSGSFHGAPKVAEWVLWRRTTEPAKHTEVQHWSPPGSTVGGQPSLALGRRQKFDQWVTLVTGRGTVAVRLTETVALGIIDPRGGETVWWTASPVPLIADAPWTNDEVIALVGALHDLSVVPLAILERARKGEFSAQCGRLPDLHSLNPGGDPDGFLYCLDDSVALVSAWDRKSKPGKETLASYVAYVFRGSEKTHIHGRFVRMFRQAGKLALVVAHADGTLTRHPLAIP